MDFYLSEIKSKENLKELFIEKWNWESPKISNLFFNFSDEIRNKIDESLILCEKLNYKIFFFDLNNLERPEKELKSVERKIIIEPQLKELAENSMFIFSADNFKYLDFIKAEKVGVRLRIKRFSISPENKEKLRTPSEQLGKLRLESEKVTSSYIKNQLEEVFSVEAVTERFYEEYVEIFNKLKNFLVRQKVEIYEGKKEEKLRNFIHQTLDRIMFFYFVQKRGCFGGDKNFLVNFWDAYKNKFNGENKFHKDWLSTLFFEALCLPFSQKQYFFKEKSYLKEFVDVLINAPYLNGGLFEKNELDEIGWKISDELFDDIFEFFESYNFTIEETTPFEIDIAINPEMLGNIYEQLVNVEEKEEQAKAGIFYTPKEEIELMLRRAFVEFIFGKTKIEKKKLYQFFFPEMEEEIEAPFSKEEAEKVLKELEEIIILDPACGSGHYLVVAAQLLYKFKKVLWEKLNWPHLSKYEEKKKIIERNIYGNDIKEWATNIAKLRLWLDLFVDAEEEVLKNQMEPLLPNLSFKIRFGDGLVQRIGRETIPLRKIKSFVGTQRNALKNLIQKKEYVYKTSGQEEYKKTLYLEKKLLWNALDDYKIEAQQKIQRINSQLNKIQFDLFGENIEDKQKTLFEKELKKEKKSLEATLNDISKFEEELRKQKEVPMLWDLAFAEVFQMENKKGFDIVIANPPYVRQERIEDLTGFYPKKEYKEKLIQQMREDWYRDYEGETKFGVKSPIPHKFDRKCDLYVYFYLKGLKLLNPDGVLCYISSNSWLDVQFGRVLQEVLLKRVPIVAIYDNQVKRSFKHADINTIIAIFKAPKMKDFDEEIKQNEVSFVMFKKPFEEIMFSEIFIDLEKDEGFKKYPEGKRRETEIFRIHKINQKELFEFGKDKNTGEYIGHKWGGKYLRAPEIYWVILEKGKDKLIPLEQIVHPRFDVKTGIIKFFYLSKEDLERWQIEKEFLYPIIRSTKDCKTIVIKEEQIRFQMFYCDKPKSELRKTQALKYIEWGEKQKRPDGTLWINAPSLRGRQIWYYPDVKFYDLLWWVNIGDRYACFYNPKKFIAADNKFYGFEKRINFNSEKFVLLMNSTLVLFFAELSGQELTGALTFLHHTIENLEKMWVVDLSKVNFKKIKDIKRNLFSREIKSIFTELGFDPNKPIREQEPNPLPDRKALDDIVFDALGLTEEERKEVYWSVAELVKNRLEKAKSV